MGLPPLWTLVFLYLGFKIHGISGMIIAVPLGLFVMNLSWLFCCNKKHSENGTGKSWKSWLLSVPFWLILFLS